MTTSKKVLALLFPMVIVFVGVALFFDSMQTAVAATELTAPLEKKTAVSPSTLLSQTSAAAQALPVCATPTRILPAGDSITQGQNSSSDAGYRLPLFLALRNAGYNVNFVGNLMNGPEPPGFDYYHEGHGSKKAQYFEFKLANWIGIQNADVVLYHVGTNDVPNSISSAITSTTTILDEVDAYELTNSRAVTVVLAQIINRPCTGPFCVSEQTATSTYNADLQTLVNTRTAAGDNLVLVDMENDAGLVYDREPAGDFADNLHPNDGGYEKMVTVWYDALINILPPPCATPPLIVHNAVTETAVNNRYTYQVLASGASNLSYSLTSPPAGMSIDANTGIINWIPTIAQLGTNSITIEVNNSAGTDSYTFNLGVINTGMGMIQSPHEKTILKNSNLLFTVSVTNTGALTLTTVPVEFPQSPSCPTTDIGPITPGSTATATCNVTNITTTFTHTAYVTATDSLATQIAASDVSTVNVIDPQLQIVKTPANQTILINDTANFTVSITNTGDVDLTNVSVSDLDVPACSNANLGTLAVGANETYPCSLSNATTDLINSTITTTGTHQIGQSTATDQINVDIIDPQITLVISPDLQHILSGNNATFTITGTNAGDVNLTNVTLSAPAVSCDKTDFGTLAFGTSDTANCSATNVTADFLNNISVTGNHVLGQVSDNTSAYVDVFSNQIDIVQTADPYAMKGSNVSFSITVTNTSGTEMTNVTIHDPAAGCMVTLPTLAEGAQHTEICSITNAQSDIINTAFVTSTLPNLTSTSSSDLALVDVIDPGINIVVTPNTQKIDVNTDATLTITVSNTGDTLLNNVSVSMTSIADCTRNQSLLAAQTDWQFSCVVSAITDDVTKTAAVTAQYPLGTLQAEDTTIIEINQSFIFLPLVIK